LGKEDVIKTVNACKVCLLFDASAFIIPITHNRCTIQQNLWIM